MIIDCHSHYEPGILPAEQLIQRMRKQGVNKTVLISRVTDIPLYKKPGLMMAIQRFMMQQALLRPAAKMIDNSFHRKKGEWNPWFRSMLGRQAIFKILLEPDNQSVANIIQQYPNHFLGWIFINPMQDHWAEELNKYITQPGMIGIKVHPFWHRYSILQLYFVAKAAEKYDFPLLIHLGFDQAKAVREFCHCFPKVKMIFAHAAVPLYSAVWPVIKSTPNKYIDCSSHHVDRHILKKAIHFLGPNKCLYGTDDPYSEPNAGIIIKNWISNLSITMEDKEKIFYKNFIEIMPTKLREKVAC